MIGNFLNELAISLVLLLLLVFLLNPFDFLMPSSLVMLLALAVTLAFLLFASFIWREKTQDEREAFHKLQASRWAYLAGTSFLVLGIIIQTIKHSLDSWLIITLSIMVIFKVVALIYTKIKN
ncbi:hypothetical protein HY025_00675 [Candidatus Daviesbacteria bacterium]|nr:hypothetical protein [Candidatus Daviesbacteria bacterium]